MTAARVAGRRRPRTALWADYQATGDRELRDQLILHYAPLVKYVAGRVAVGLPHQRRARPTSSATASSA